MKKHISALLALIFAAGPNLAVASQIQQQGIKTLAQCIAGGATGATCLPLASQVWDSTNGQQLSASIANGQLGGGGGSKNYLSSYVPSLGGGVANTGNGDFELNATTGWSLAHSSLTSLFPTSVATAATPFDSTHGGSAASGNLSLAIESTAPIQKKYSGKLVSSAASTAGDMLISSAFYIDSVDQSQPMTITLSSKVTVNPSNLNFSGTSSNSFAIYVYDVTAATWIQPSGVYGMVSNGVYNVKNVVFQPQSNTSTQYQLAIININASSGAYTMLLDAVGVGPQASVSAPAMSDWTAFTSTFSAGFGTVTSQTCYWRRVGDSDQVNCFGVAGTVAASVASATLPLGQAIDFTKINAGTGNGNILGFYQSTGTGAISTSNYAAYPFTDGSTSNQVFFAQASAGSVLTKANGTSIGTTGQNFMFSYQVPIVGWSSNTVSSADTDTGVVAALVAGNPASAAANAPIIFPTVLKDTRGSYSASTGKYTAPVSGIYRVTAYLYGSTTSNDEILAIFSGSVGTRGMGTIVGGTGTGGGSAIGYMNAGDTVFVTTAAGGTSSLNTFTNASFERLSGPAVVQATESIDAKYSGVPTGTLTTSFNQATLPTKKFDSHNAMSAGVYTIPVSGVYRVSAALAIQSTPVSGDGTGIQIVQAGSTSDSATMYVNNLSSTDGPVTASYPSISTTFKCVTGDTIKVNGYAAGASAAYNTAADRSWFSIERVGN